MRGDAQAAGRVHPSVPGGAAWRPHVRGEARAAAHVHTSVSPLAGGRPYLRGGAPAIAAGVVPLQNPQRCLRCVAHGDPTDNGTIQRSFPDASIWVTRMSAIPDAAWLFTRG